MEVILLLLLVLLGFGTYRLWIRVDELAAQQPLDPDDPRRPQPPSLLAWIRQLGGRR